MSDDKRPESISVPARPVSTSGKTKPRPGRWMRRLLWTFFILILLLAAAGAGLYKWREISLDNLRRAHAAALENVRQEEAEARRAIVERRRQDLGEQAGKLLRLTAMPLSWAVRTELLQQDYDDISIYFRALIAEPGITRVALIVPDEGQTTGLVKVSSDQKLEGSAAGEMFPKLDFSGEKPQVVVGARDVSIVVPVMGLNARLGTVILSYEAPVPGQLPQRSEPAPPSPPASPASPSGESEPSPEAETTF